MAGSFGFTREHWETSMKIAELVVLPAVRSAGKDDLIIADGFSCREQIAQATDRRGLHLAEVVHLALQRETGVMASNGKGRSPETSYLHQNRLERNNHRRTALFGMALLAGAGLLWFLGARNGRAGSVTRRTDVHAR